MNIMIIANLLIVVMVFLVLPYWLIGKLKFDRKVKLSIGFNYYGLMIVIYLGLMICSSLNTARKVAQENVSALSRALKEYPSARVQAALEKWLQHGEESYFLLKNELPVEAPEPEPPTGK